MRREELEALVEAGLTVRQIAAQTSKGYSTIRYWLAKYGLRTKHRGPGRASRLEAGERVCARHGLVRFVRDSHGTRCSKCRSAQVARRRRRVKRILVREAGGRCARCGYDRYVGALQFHHLDPAEKSFHLGMGGLTRSLDAMRAEAAKCVLLCSNCHAEVEGGFVSLV
jgi:5-methylcytosine-specific restriction endonuclease McrA